MNFLRQGKALAFGLCLFWCLLFALPFETSAALPYSGEQPIRLSSDAYVQDGHSYWGTSQMIEKLKKTALLRDGSTLYFTVETDSYAGGKNFESVLMDYILPSIYAHTGNPVEGDYLYCGMHNVRSSWSLASSPNGRGRYEIYVTNRIEYRTTAAQEKEMDARLSSLLSSLNLKGKSDYGKLRTMYDWVVKNVTYDKSHLNDPSYLGQFTAYAALIRRTAVCQGYAALFYRMCLMEGINARVVFSEDHAWNIVRLGSLYYNVDATAGSHATYPEEFFLKSDADIGPATHKRLAEFLTPAFLKTYPMATKSYGTETQGRQTLVQLSTGSLSLKVGNSATLRTNIVPLGADTVKSYVSSKPYVATVSSSGKVKAKSEGSCVIVMTTRGGVTKNCNVTVSGEPLTRLTFKKSAVTVKVGKRKKLSYTKFPMEATERVLFSSSNTQVVKVSTTGMISGKKKGRAVVTIKSASGSVTDTCVVIVR